MLGVEARAALVVRRKVYFWDRSHPKLSSCSADSKYRSAGLKSSPLFVRLDSTLMQQQTRRFLVHCVAVATVGVVGVRIRVRHVKNAAQQPNLETDAHSKQFPVSPSLSQSAMPPMPRILLLQAAGLPRSARGTRSSRWLHFDSLYSGQPHGQYLLLKRESDE